VQSNEPARGKDEKHFKAYFERITFQLGRRWQFRNNNRSPEPMIKPKITIYSLGRFMDYYVISKSMSTRRLTFDSSLTDELKNNYGSM
jgi:hypothetical protein